jgi:hypothetical protein
MSEMGPACAVGSVILIGHAPKRRTFENETETSVMVLLLQPLFGSADSWRRLLNTAMPEIEARIWPEIGNLADIELAAVWALPPGTLAKLPNLRLIVSLTAGTDALLRDPDLPSVPIIRAGDTTGDAMMNVSSISTCETDLTA